MTELHEARTRIDIVSDVVCPWCIIGYKQLDKALSLTGVIAKIVWHPFELNPHMPLEGENLREHLAAKYGTSLEDSTKARRRLTTLGEELGFKFNYADDMRMYNTFRAHQMLHWAVGKGQQHPVKLALFEAFFTRRLNVNNPDILAASAEAVGLDRNEALAVLADGRFSNGVRREQAFWIARGIQGVPAMIFNQRHLVTGAQGVENYSAILRQFTKDNAA